MPIYSVEKPGPQYLLKEFEPQYLLPSHKHAQCATHAGAYFTPVFFFLSVNCFSGTHILLNISSKPTLPQLDKLIVSSVASDWEQVATHLGVEPFLIDTVKADNPGHCEERCRGVLNRWLNAKPGSGTMERTWPSVLKVLEESGHRQVALQLRRDHFGESSEGHASELTSPPGRNACTLD